MDSTPSLSQMSPGVKVTAAVVTGGGVLGLVRWLFSDYLWVIVIGAALMAVALSIYAFFLRRAARRKARGFVGEVSQGTGANVGGVSDPRKLAQLDDLHKKFLEGLRVFEAKGKDLYFLPWFLIIGEPGSGKSQAIEHSNLGLPNLNKPQAGTGGTINMDWWFAMDAVLLDTAGRLLFEEVDATTTNEWETFLRMLAKHRPNCPINGLLLVIPADSLIKDGSDEIQRKGGRIAQQLDKIQAVLGVRFPVFLVITKCDLINGCRQFFERLDDVERQHQMLGWSNPAGLDEPFDPAVVERHLDQVAQRLRRRRMGLLLDPVHTDSPDAPRLDQVDDLFAFPDSLQRIGPRLKRYLELIFTTNTWSGMPLFLRGIYFTSSLQEGKALDADLAEALGISVESLQTPIWEKSRAYFLRDLFLKKVFREKGLVTRATNTRSLKRRRKIALLGTGFAAALVLAALSWLGASTLESRMGKASKDWPVAAANVGKAPIIEYDKLGPPFWNYRANGQLVHGSTTVRIRDFYADALKQIEDPAMRIEVPGIFRIWPTADLNTMRQDAFRRWVEVGLLRPAADAAMSALRSDTALWNDPVRRPHAVAALEQLLRIEACRRDNIQLRDAPLIEISPLLRLILTDDQYAGYETNDKITMERVVAWCQQNEAKQNDPARQRLIAAAMVGSEAELTAAIDTGVAAFTSHWASQVSASGQATAGAGDSMLIRITALRDALDAHTQAELALLQVVPDPPVQSKLIYDQVTGNWREKFAVLWRLVPGGAAPQGTFVRLDAALKNVQDSLKVRLTEENQFATVRQKVETEVLTRARQEYGVLLKAVEPIDALDPAARTALPLLEMTQKKLREGRTAMENQVGRDLDSLRDRWASYESQLLRAAGTAGGNMHIFVVRFNMYDAANKALTDTDPDAKLVFAAEEVEAAGQRLSAQLRELREKVKAGQAAMPQPLTPGGPADTNQRAWTAALGMIDLCERGRKFEMAAALLDAAPDSVERWKTDKLIDPAKLGRLNRPVIALTAGFAQPGDFTPEFHPARMKTITQVMATAAAWSAKSVEPAQHKPRLDAVSSSLDDYRQEHLTYWTSAIDKDARFEGPKEWRLLLNALHGLDPAHINGQLNTLTEASIKALKELRPADAPAATELDRNIDKAIATLDKELTRFNRNLNETCNSKLKNWLALGNDVEIDNILELRSDIFVSKYVMPDSPAYWWQMMLHMLNALGTERDRQTTAAADHLLSEQRAARFPLVRDGDRTKALTPEELADAYVQVRKLNLGGSARRFNPGTLGAGETADLNKTLADCIALLKGGEPPQGRKDLLERMYAVLDALCVPNKGADRDKPFIASLACKLVPASDQNRGKGQYDFQVRLGDARHEIGRDRTGYAHDAAVPIAFLYFPDSNREKPADEWMPQSPWPLLELWLDSRQARHPGTDVLIETRNQKRRHWIGLTFDPKLPDFDKWPSLKNDFKK